MYYLSLKKATTNNPAFNMPWNLQSYYIYAYFRS